MPPSTQSIHYVIIAVKFKYRPPQYYLADPGPLRNQQYVCMHAGQLYLNADRSFNEILEHHNHTS